MFPHLPDKAFASFGNRSPDILIGNNYLGLHPVGGSGRDCVGDLKAYQSDFGNGWVLGGTHPALRTFSCQFALSAYNLAKVNKCEVIPGSLDKFWFGESLGVSSPRRCGKCLRCPDCTDPALIRSRNDQDELDILKKNVRLVNGQLHVNYPFIRDPTCLPFNRNSVLRMAKNQEKRLEKLGLLIFSLYNEELRKYVDRGVIVQLSK